MAVVHDAPAPAATVDRPPTRLHRLFGPGLAALRRYYKPFAAIEIAALALVIAYRYSPATRAVCDVISSAKVRAGMPGVALAAALAGGIVPEIAKTLTLGRPGRGAAADGRPAKWHRDIGFNFVYFAVNGIIADRFFSLQGVMFGHGTNFGTSVSKMLFDQFVFTPIWGVPFGIVFYRWRAQQYRLRPTLGELSARYYAVRVLPLLIPNWCFWTPMVMLLYSMPGPLQFCMYAAALAAWSLLMTFVARGEHEVAGTPIGP